MLAIAALFHDTGFVIQYDDNEVIGAKIARNYLRTVLYNEDKIKTIENITLEETKELAKELFDEKYYSWTILGDVE